MMKRNVLAVVIPALLAAGAVNAAEIYNKDGNKLALTGKAVGLYYLDVTSNTDKFDNQGDNSYVRLGFHGETQINSELTGYGKWEYNFDGHSQEGSATSDKTRLAYAGLKFGHFGSFDFGRNYGVSYDVGKFTDVAIEFGGDSYAATDTYMTQRARSVATYRNDNAFGMVDGMSFALQYQAQADSGSSNGEGFGIATTYTIADTGATVGASYTSSDNLVNGIGKADVWNIGAKYDANNVYAAVVYAETRNVRADGKVAHIEAVAQYNLDFGLKPSVTYVQSKVSGGDKYQEYVEVGANYTFNKNMSTYIAYRADMLKADSGYANNDIVATGLVYQF